ncbi:hypothetical protein GF325_01605 [Candidatus Bathyarchaeota archaeon]|nr:hypothetical protein [Candidatus Bathyarchaeota archaeon]
MVCLDLNSECTTIFLEERVWTVLMSHQACWKALLLGCLSKKLVEYKCIAMLPEVLFSFFQPAFPDPSFAAQHLEKLIRCYCFRVDEYRHGLFDEN